MMKSDFTILVADDDPDFLFQTIFNLEKAGYKTVAAESQTEAEAVITVSDTGIGIKKSDTENLFTEFVRIKNEKTKDISGSGPGLSIVKKVVELYFGTVEVESTPDAGTIFTVRLPKKPVNIN